MDAIISKTEAASPAFIKELVRKAAFMAAEEESTEANKLSVTDRHFDQALQEMILSGGGLTRNVLGFGAKPS